VRPTSRRLKASVLRGAAEKAAPFAFADCN
jgi:hypothetical protein